MQKMQTLYPVGLAARRAGLSAEYIRALCNRGLLNHVKDASGHRLVPGDALDDLIRERAASPKPEKDAL
jgi:DNA-binding transcriptional MerR regulator